MATTLGKAARHLQPPTPRGGLAHRPMTAHDYQVTYKGSLTTYLMTFAPMNVISRKLDFILLSVAVSGALLRPHPLPLSAAFC